MALATVKVVQPENRIVVVGSHSMITPLVAAMALSLAGAQDAAAAAGASVGAAAAIYGSVEALNTAVSDAQAARDAAQQAVIDAEEQVALAADQVALAAAQVALAAAQRVLADAAAADAQAAENQAELVALAAGADIVSTLSAATPNGKIELLKVGPGLEVYEVVAAAWVSRGWLLGPRFTTPAVMLASASASLGPTSSIVEAGRHRYQVVTSGEHLTTAGGVKLIVLPDARGYSVAAFGVDLTGVASANVLLTIIDAAAVAAGVPWYGSPGTASLTASITHAATVIPNGMLFSFAGGVVQTFDGQFIAGRENVFVGSVGASVGPRWGAGTVDEIFPEWFGARSRKVSGGTPYDSSPAAINVNHAVARGVYGFTYKQDWSQGIYDFASKVTKPVSGVVHVVGQGVSTQFRGMNGGSGYPDSIWEFTASTTNTRFEGINFYGGSAARPTKYAVYATELRHTNFNECFASCFSVAAFTSSDNDNAFTNLEIGECGVGIWARRAGGNNNDLLVDTVRFVSCEMAIALNPGTSVRIVNCQLQASLAAPFTKGFIYAQGVTGLAIDANYFETQPTGGLAGMAFTTPTTWQLYASIIFNNSPYYADEIGTVTTTLAQSSGNAGSVGSITNNYFAAPTYGAAGAGGSAYTAGAVSFVALTGSGTGASGTCTVSGGAVTSATAGTPGAGFMVGDIVRVDQGGNQSAVMTVAAVGANNGIATLYVGHAAAIYPGHVRSLAVIGNGINPNMAIFAFYNSRTVCEPRKLDCRQNAWSTSPQYQLIGPVTATVDVRLGNMAVNNVLYNAATNMGLAPVNYVPSSFAFTATPTVSTFVRNAGRYRQYPWYRFALLPGQQVSDILSFSIPVATSGLNNPDLVGLPVYLSALKLESAANVKLRLVLEYENGSNTLMRQNYDTSTSFTKVTGEEREEVSLTVGAGTGTLRGKIQVIAASAASQYVDIMGAILTVAGVPVEVFPRSSFERPLQASAAWTPGLIAAGATSAPFTIECFGARAGDIVDIGEPIDTAGFVLSKRSVSNGTTLTLRNVTAGGLTPTSATWRSQTWPTT